MTHHIDISRFTPRQTRVVHDVVDHCRKNGIDKAQERKLLLLFGRFATRHELQMNTKRPPLNLR
ncbi:hypothetical protein [Shinella sp. M31]|uniref:hypothetical protein n=1 Tax=Shinella sp. M31 TaxID=3368615 RepID=UPI0028D3A6F6|nr:hypothetical protein [uncultured Shinella sp.]